MRSKRKQGRGVVAAECSENLKFVRKDGFESDVRGVIKGLEAGLCCVISWHSGVAIGWVQMIITSAIKWDPLGQILQHL